MQHKNSVPIQSESDYLKYAWKSFENTNLEKPESLEKYTTRHESSNMPITEERDYLAIKMIASTGLYFNWKSCC